MNGTKERIINKKLLTLSGFLLSEKCLTFYIKYASINNRKGGVFMKKVIFKIVLGILVFILYVFVLDIALGRETRREDIQIKSWIDQGYPVPQK
jgi:hypothetical protein